MFDIYIYIYVYIHIWYNFTPITTTLTQTQGACTLNKLHHTRFALTSIACIGFFYPTVLLRYKVPILLSGIPNRISLDCIPCSLVIVS